MTADDNKLLPKNITEEVYKKNYELLTERRHAEELLYAVSEAVFAVDHNLKITLFNHAAEIMFDKKKSDVLNKMSDDIVKLNTLKEIPIKGEHYCFQNNSKKANLDSIVLKTDKKDYYVNLKTSMIKKAGGNDECVVTLVDITKEKQLEKTKDEFISVTSHELRTPITIIKSYLWMLQHEKGGALTEKQKAYIDKAIKGAERLLNLINDILNIARIEQGKIEIKIDKIPVLDLVSDLAAEFKIKTDEKGLGLKIDLDPRVPYIFADKGKLREVFTNLVGNAIKFTQQGEVTIKSQKTSDTEAKFSIIDTGKGIPQDDLDKLFHKFGRLDNSFQTVAEAGGTGLGLYIVKSLVETMGGKAEGHSEGTGKGSTFWFTVPTIYIHNNNEHINTIVNPTIAFLPKKNVEENISTLA